MRIGILCYPTYGGSGVVATELGRHLARRGNTIHIISFDRPFRLAGAAGYEENLYFHQVHMMGYAVLKTDCYTTAAAVKMAELVREEGLEILHSHYAVPHAVSAMLAKQMCNGSAVRLVTTIHGTDITLVGSNPAYAPAVQMGLNQSDAIVSVSQWLARETEQRFDLNKRCEVIYNFVDSAHFARNHKDTARFREQFAKPEEKILLHISNFRPVKRVEDVILIFSHVAQAAPSILLMVGDGPDREKAIELARDLHILNRVRFLGLQENIADFLSIADALLFPSQYESFGLAVLEAMACEVPVVCSDGGGLPEVMVHGETGYLCSVGAVKCMANRVLDILRNPEKAAVMGKAGRARAISHFSVDAALDAHEKLYQSLLEK